MEAQLDRYTEAIRLLRLLAIPFTVRSDAKINNCEAIACFNFG
ncbi:MAG: hypothetical protein ACOYMQ_17720 [Pseudanabaena sp.]